MSDLLYRTTAGRTQHEPKVHPLVAKSFIFVPTVAMRVAPEILILEFMREVFFKIRSEGDGKEKQLKPDEDVEGGRKRYSESERAVIYAFQGRSKKNKKERFFAPAYPALAESSQVRKKDPRIINSLLLRGPIAQHLWHNGQSVGKKEEQEKIIEKIYRALLGHRSWSEGSPAKKEILAVALGKEAFNFDRDLAIGNLRRSTQYSVPDPDLDPEQDFGNGKVMRVERDELADRITNDLKAICDLEAKVPRMQWLQLLMTFLRFALPMWLLAQMQITSLLHKWLLAAFDKGIVTDEAAIYQEIAGRNRGLLHPTLTATRELAEHTENYMKRRIELDIMLGCLEKLKPEETKKKRLDFSGDRDALSIKDLLRLANETASGIRTLDRFKEVAKDRDVGIFLAREGEEFNAWRNPFKSGQGVNIDEFFRVLIRDEDGSDEGGGLLKRDGTNTSASFKVFPGQLLLKTITQLAAVSKSSARGCGGGGKLVLQDVEDHFAQYGIDFSVVADARENLVRQLQAMELLTGSPDAGSSVAVAIPYRVTLGEDR